MLHPGESASFDLPADFILGDGDVRAEIRPLLLVGEGCATRRVIPTLEVIEDATGMTCVLYAPVTGACGASQ